MIMPGDDAKFTVIVVVPIAMSEKLNFAIREGGRTVELSSNKDYRVALYRSVANW